jgi:hypothetical protein
MIRRESEGGRGFARRAGLTIENCLESTANFQVGDVNGRNRNSCCKQPRGSPTIRIRRSDGGLCGSCVLGGDGRRFSAASVAGQPARYVLDVAIRSDDDRVLFRASRSTRTLEVGGSRILDCDFGFRVDVSGQCRAPTQHCMAEGIGISRRRNPLDDRTYRVLALAPGRQVYCIALQRGH